jgi:hypothetical protein
MLFHSLIPRQTYTDGFTTTLNRSIVYMDMKKIIFISLLVGIPAYFLGKVIWPPDLLTPVPNQAHLPYFIFLSIMESLAFGGGIGFIIFGWPSVKKFAGGLNLRAAPIFIALSWMLISWWPHDNLHAHNGLDPQGLLYIEYGFHFTTMLAGFILIHGFLTANKKFKK